MMTKPRGYVAVPIIQFYQAQLKAQQALSQALELPSIMFLDGDLWRMTDQQEAETSRALARFTASKARLNTTSTVMAEWIARYTLGAVLGEARHRVSRCDLDDLPRLREELRGIPKGTSRNQLVRRGLAAPRPADWLEELRTLSALFHKGVWAKGYGGRSWGRITDLLIMYLEGRIPSSVFVDQAVDLEHNSGTYFDKLEGLYTEGLHTILDAKKTGDEHFRFAVERFWDDCSGATFELRKLEDEDDDE